jgi:hypothetical protein
MAGYSGTPLGKKLGYKPGMRAHVSGEPDGYRDSLGLDKGSVTWLTTPENGCELVHMFVKDAAALLKALPKHLKLMARDGTIWVSWPKKASKVATDLTEDRIREIALPLGLVDVKVCAVDDNWSGLKLVVRKELR